MSARFTLLFALIVMGASRSALPADAGTPPFAPEKYDLARYQKIWERSPFIVETIVVQDNPGLAAKYALVGLVESGENSVAFLDEGGKTFMLSKKHPDSERNLEMVAIMADKDFRKSSVTIKQGAEKATLPFDPRAIVAMGGSANPDAGMPPQSAVPPNPGIVPAMRPPTAPGGGQTSLPGGTANTSARIVAPNVAQPTPVNATGGQTPPTPIRRIIRPKIDVNN